MNQYPPGNPVNVYFAFLTRPLTNTEDATFRTPGTLGTLPTGAGTDPVNVYLDVMAPNEEQYTTSQYPTGITKLSVGSYQGTVSIPLDADPAEWRWRMRGTNSDGSPAAASFWQRFSSSSE